MAPLGPVFVAAVAAGFPDPAACETALAEELAEDLSSWSDDEVDDNSKVSDLLEELVREAAAFRENPVDLNRASAALLARIPGIDPATAASIVALRTEVGRFESVEDLARAGWFSELTVRSLRPYVVCRPGPGKPVSVGLPHPDSAGSSRRRAEVGVSGGEAAASPRRGVERAGTSAAWELRVRSSVGFAADDRWAAESLDDLPEAAGSYVRFRLSRPDGWSGGAAIERDPWEDSLSDHLSFHLSRRCEDRGPAFASLSFTVGDMVVDWGQGLLESGATFASAGRFPRSSDRVRGYDGAGEAAARRGVYVEAARGIVRVDVVATRTMLDAACEEGRATSIRTTGHHRTRGELSGENALREECAAARLSVSPVPWASVRASA
ncbi:MAG: hypothetical protein GF400_09090, partial [Candidatus Eisenbacteria bacterium]|nr:hypothetical protein [Candidatus Eisenbacteria bacterium]